MAGAPDGPVALGSKRPDERHSQMETLLLVLASLFAVVDVATVAMFDVLSRMDTANTSVLSLAFAAVAAKIKRPGAAALAALKGEAANAKAALTAADRKSIVPYLTAKDASGKPRIMSAMSAMDTMFGVPTATLLDKIKGDSEYALPAYRAAVAFRTVIETDDGRSYPLVEELSQALIDAELIEPREDSKGNRVPHSRPYDLVAAMLSQTIDRSRKLSDDDSWTKAYVPAKRVSAVLDALNKAAAAHVKVWSAPALPSIGRRTTAQAYVTLVNIRLPRRKADGSERKDAAGNVMYTTTSVKMSDALQGTRQGKAEPGLADTAWQYFRDTVLSPLPLEVLESIVETCTGLAERRRKAAKQAGKETKTLKRKAS